MPQAYAQHRKGFVDIFIIIYIIVSTEIPSCLFPIVFINRKIPFWKVSNISLNFHVIRHHLKRSSLRCQAGDTEFSAGSNSGQTESIQLRFLWNWCFRMAAVQSMCKILHKQNVVCTCLSAGSGHQGDDFSHVSAKWLACCRRKWEVLEEVLKI